MQKTAVLQDKKVNIKMVLSGLWTAIMFVYLYADVLSLFRPGIINKMIDGYMGPFRVDQMALLLAGLLMLVSIIMIPLSLLLAARANRIVNIVAAIFLSLVAVANIMGEVWIYYLVYGIIELVITIAIIILSIRWPVEA